MNIINIWFPTKLVITFSKFWFWQEAAGPSGFKGEKKFSKLRKLYSLLLLLLWKRCPWSDFRGRTNWSKSGTPTSHGNTITYCTELEKYMTAGACLKPGILCKSKVWGKYKRSSCMKQEPQPTDFLPPNPLPQHQGKLLRPESLLAWTCPHFLPPPGAPRLSLRSEAWCTHTARLSPSP